MRKIILFLLMIIFSLQIVACSGGNGGSDDSGNGKPQYSEVYSYNETHHWRNEINGSGRIDYNYHFNDGGRCDCGKYYDSSSVLTYTKKTINGVEGYVVSAYDKYSTIVHVEIPSYYKGEGDATALPVLSIGGSCFKESWLESIKLNEGLKYIYGYAFQNCSSLTEIVFPNSVIYVADYQVLSGCTSLTKVVMSDNIEIIGPWMFSGCTKLEQLVFTPQSKLNQIKGGAFYNCKALKSLVLPASLMTIYEYQNIYEGKYVGVTRCFDYTEQVFLYITAEELRARTVPIYERDVVTGEVIEDGIQRVPGYVEGWCGMADIYYEGEWHYDSDGLPVPN